MVQFILSGIQSGVGIGYFGPQRSLVSPNWPSSLENRVKVTEVINNNLYHGRVAGPWDHPPLANFVSSPLGAVTKKHTDKVRVIHDLSWPPGQSVNDGISKEDYTLSYSTIDDAVDKCLLFSEPCWMAKCDLKNAFTHIITRPADWNQLGFQWEGKYYISTCLPFGMRSSPKLFDIFAQGLEYMAIQNGTSLLTSHYLDDTITIEGSQATCNHSINVLKSTAKSSGMDIHEDLPKCTKAAQEMEYLGVIINTVSRELRISEERLSDTEEELKTWINRKVCTKRQLLSLIGKLSFIARVVRSARTFLRHLIDLSKKARHLHFKLKLNSQTRIDIQWWLDSIRSHNGVAMFPEPWVFASTLQLWTDASDLAGGAVFGEHWFCVPFARDKAWCAYMSICWRELYMVVKAVKTWAKELENKRIILNVDNMAACHCINKGCSKNADLMELIRALYFILVQHNIECRAFYLPSEANVCADAISRYNFETFRKARPSAGDVMYSPIDFCFYGDLI